MTPRQKDIISRVGDVWSSRINTSASAMRFSSRASLANRLTAVSMPHSFNAPTYRTQRLVFYDRLSRVRPLHRGGLNVSIGRAPHGHVPQMVGFVQRVGRSEECLDFWWALPLRKQLRTHNVRRFSQSPGRKVRRKVHQSYHDMAAILARFSLKPSSCHQ